MFNRYAKQVRVDIESISYLSIVVKTSLDSVFGWRWDSHRTSRRDNVVGRLLQNIDYNFNFICSLCVDRFGGINNMDYIWRKVASCFDG